MKKTPTPPAPTPHVAAARAYARDVLAWKLPACRWVRLACERWTRDLARASRPGARTIRDPAFPFVFDTIHAERVCRFISRLPHVKGEWARRDVSGQWPRIQLEPWQCFILANLFGFRRHADGCRRFRHASIYVPRKNAKSTLAAGVAWWMFGKDDEPGAEVYCGATTKRQAMEVFKPARQMAIKLPALASGLGVEIHKENLSRPADGAKFEPVVGQPGDGASPHLAIVDEFHEHPTRALVDTMQTGMGARRQPMLFIISTAGDNLEGPCRQDWRECQRLLAGELADDSHFAIIYTLDEGDDWWTETALRKANPNLGVSIYTRELLAAAEVARHKPSTQAAFKTKHLNVWVQAMAGYFDVPAFARCADPALAISAYARRACYVGIDFAAKRDLCAVMRLFPEPDGKSFAVFGRYYLPRATVALPQNHHYRQWEEGGHVIVSDGNANDFARICDDLLADAKVHEITEIPYDPYQSQATVQDWMKAGLKCVEFPQGWRHFSEPMKQLDVLITEGHLRHPDDPVLAWTLGNVVAKEDTRGNVYPRKEHDADKIDPVVALIMALARALVRPPPPPAPRLLFL